MKTLFSLFLLLAVPAFHAEAQIPGYLGKRFMVNLGTDLGFRIGLAGTDHVASYKHSTGIGFNHRNWFSADYVLTRSAVIAVELGFQRYGGVLKQSSTYDNHSISYTDPFTGYVQSTSLPLYAAYSATQYGFQLRKFLFRKQGNLAPLGVHVDWGIRHSAIRAQLDEGPWKRTYTEGCTSLTLAFGGNYIFYDRILFGFGVQVAALPLFAYRQDIRDNGDVLDNYYKEASGYKQGGFSNLGFERSTLSSLMNFRLQLGCLIF